MCDDMTVIFSERNQLKSTAYLKPDEMTDSLKNCIWNEIYKFMSHYKRSLESYNSLIEFLWGDFFGKCIDELRVGTALGSLCEYGIHFIKDEYFLIKEWWRVYDFLECILRACNEVSQNFASGLNAVFQDKRAPYQVISNTVIPIISDLERNQIFRALQMDEADTVANHINKALNLFSLRPTPDYENSIKESISAVEALVKVKSNSKEGTLGALVNRLPMHQAFRKALSNLYGWTSDQGGIRHGAYPDVLPVGKAEAQFMLVICSAFVNYINFEQ